MAERRRPPGNVQPRGDRYGPYDTRSQRPPSPPRYVPDQYSRQSQYERPYDRYDRYDRNDRNDRYARAPSPEPYPRSRYHDRTPSWLPERPMNGHNDGFTFRGAADRNSHHPPPPPRAEEDFSFRAPGPPAPRFPPWLADPPLQAPSRPIHDRIGQRGRSAQGQPYQRGNRMLPSRGRPRKPAAHERDILTSSHRDTTPEQLEGMNEASHPRFIDTVSDDDVDEVVDLTRDTDSDNDGGPRKRVNTGDESAKEPPAPKWSNPEYFTALPPPENASGPKKDIVQAIRKAKAEPAVGPPTSSNAVKDNDDFISFSVDPDPVDDSSRESSPERDMSTSANAPTPQEAREALKNAWVEYEKARMALDYTDTPANRRALQAVIQTYSYQRERLTKPLKVGVLSGKDAKRYPPLESPDVQHALNGHSHQLPSTYPDSKPLVARGSDVYDFIPPPPPPSTPPPPPPPGLVMPTDEELAAQYGGGNKGQKRKREERPSVLGGVVPEWQAYGDIEESTPWCTVNHVHSANTPLRLHKEICDFYKYVKPHKYEEAVRRNLVLRVEQAMRSCPRLPGGATAMIRSFGSFAAGLYLPVADMDLVAVSPGFLKYGTNELRMSNSKMHALSRHFIKTKVAKSEGSVVISKARVPIIKFIDVLTGIKVDVSFENNSGLKANNTFLDWKQMYPAMPGIVVLIKQLLAMRNLNEVFQGGLGGFSIICLVVNMLELTPEIQSDILDAEQHYGELFMRFLDLYGNQLDIVKTGLNMNPCGYFEKSLYPQTFSAGNSRLTILDPNNPSNDVSAGSGNIAAVLDCFRSAYASVQRRLADIESGKNVGGSILGCILGGNYSSFQHQRATLLALHDNLPLPPPLNPPKKAEVKAPKMPPWAHNLPPKPASSQPPNKRYD